MKRRVLFVCLGNICRSPLAEGIFLHVARERGVADRFEADSCGTGHWHAGEPPDHRAMAVAKRRGVHLPSIARQVDAGCDFEDFDVIVAMDASNRQALVRLGAPEERVRLMRSYDRELADARGEALDVPDPYYGGPEGFDRVFEMLERACHGLLDELLAQREAGGR